MGVETHFSGKTEKALSETQIKVNNTNRIYKTGPELKVITSHPNSAKLPIKCKKIRRRNKKMAAAISPVQRLFNTCKEVFANGGPGVVPSVENIERLRAVLDDIKPEDVGLNPQQPFFRATASGRTPAITYLHLYQCDKFSMGIFCLPPSGVIPLHDHPGMTVFGKLLLGTMHIKSYDWVADAPMQDPQTRLAKVKVDSDFTAPCKTSILYPADGGNMHRFTARTPCAVLDVLGPPYSDSEGRPCTYYFDFPMNHFSVEGVSVAEDEREGYAWLREREEKPEELNVVGEAYRGPQIVEN